MKSCAMRTSASYTDESPCGWILAEHVSDDCRAFLVDGRPGTRTYTHLMLFMPEMEAAASGSEYKTAQNRTAQGRQRQRKSN